MKLLIKEPGKKIEHSILHSLVVGFFGSMGI
jgi:hypothetical protein